MRPPSEAGGSGLDVLHPRQLTDGVTAAREATDEIPMTRGDREPEKCPCLSGAELLTRDG